MAHDYSRNAANTKRLIEKFGRDIQLHRKPRTANDSSKPWLGPNTGTATLVATVKGVIYPFKSEEMVGQLIKLGDEYCMVASTSVSPVQDLSDIDSIIDGTTVYKVISADIIGPGDTKIAYTFHVRR